MSVHNITFRIAGQAVVRSGQGKVFEIKTIPGVGTIYGLTQGIEDFGGEVVELECLRVAALTDADLSDMLRDALIEDKVVIVSGLNDSRCETTRRIETYLTHQFCAGGGRAIAVRYN